MTATGTAPGIDVTLLVENTARGRGILGEHGLAYWIDTPDGSILFDTGQGMALEHNARVCGKDLSQLRAIVLSHGHFDHTGGLEAVLRAAPQATVYLHPDALRRHFSGSAGGIHPVDERFLYGGGLAGTGARCIWTRAATEIAGGVWATGEVPRLTGYEDTGGAFFLDERGTAVDPLLDDQSLYFRSREGVVLILGCAHAGVVNTMRHVAGLCRTDRLHAVIGGMHLLHATPARLQQTHTAFREMEVARIAPCHCTGDAAVASFWSAFPGQCVEAHAGSKFRLAI